MLVCLIRRLGSPYHNLDRPFLGFIGTCGMRLRGIKTWRLEGNSPSVPTATVRIVSTALKMKFAQSLVFFALPLLAAASPLVSFHFVVVDNFFGLTIS